MAQRLGLGNRLKAKNCPETSCRQGPATLGTSLTAVPPNALPLWTQFKMPPVRREGLFSFLDGLGIETKTVEHPPVFTVSESAGVDRALPGGHTKNLFLKSAKGVLYLVVAYVETQVDLKGLPQRVGAARFSFGKPDLLLDVLGVTPGSVTAFAVLNDRDHQVQVVLDEDLMQFDSVNCHPLENNATTNIARDDLLRFIRATGHEPTIVDLKAQDLG